MNQCTGWTLYCQNQLIKLLVSQTINCSLWGLCLTFTVCVLELIHTSAIFTLHSHNTTVQYLVPALGDPRRDRPPDVYGHVINVPTHINVKLPAIGGHLPNADADSHLLVVRTCYNGQCKPVPRFRW